MTPGDRVAWLRRACADDPAGALGHLAVAAVLDEHGKYREDDVAAAVRIVSTAFALALTGKPPAVEAPCCRVTASACEARRNVGRPPCCDRCTH